MVEGLVVRYPRWFFIAVMAARAEPRMINGLVRDALVDLIDDLACGLETAELGVEGADPVRHYAV